MKKLLIAAVVLISVLGVASSGQAYTVTVTNGTEDHSRCTNHAVDSRGYSVKFMAEVNFYYNAIENVKAQTAYIQSGESYTYDSGAWCPSGVTGIMHVKQTYDDGSIKERKYIINASDNNGKHGAGLLTSCRSSTFKITDYGNNCAPEEYQDNTSFSFQRQ